jgi:hypothetical protein
MQQEVAFRPAVLLSIFDHFMRNSSQLAAESKGNEDDSSADSGSMNIV